MGLIKNLDQTPSGPSDCKRFTRAFCSESRSCSRLVRRISRAWAHLPDEVTHVWLMTFWTIGSSWCLSDAQPSWQPPTTTTITTTEQSRGGEGVPESHKCGESGGWAWIGP